MIHALPALLSLLSTANAEDLPDDLPNFAVDLYRPAFSPDGLSTAPARPTPGPTAAATLSYAHLPLTAADDSGEFQPAVSSALCLHLGPGIGVGPAWIGADLPIWLAVTGPDVPESWRAAPSPGDPRLILRLSALPADTPLPMRLQPAAALFGELIVPAGADARLGGEPGWSGVVGLAGGLQRGPLSLTLNLFSRLRPDAPVGVSTLDDTLGTSLLATYRLQPALALSAELTGEMTVQDLAADQNPGELLLSARWRWLQAGVGVGLSSALGTPASRAILALRNPGDIGM